MILKKNGPAMYLVVVVRLIDSYHQSLYKIENWVVNDNYFN